MSPNLVVVHRLVASWFGTGLILGKTRGSDLGSGTVGALFAFPVIFAIGSWWGWLAQVLAALVVVGLSLWSTRKLVEEVGDAGWIVIDEAAGTFVALIGLAFWPAVISFIVFRLADIKKEWAPGVSQAERIPGAVGVTADDLVAGAYGLVAGLVAQALL